MTHAATAAFPALESEVDTGSATVLVAMKPDDDGTAALAMGQWLADHERRDLRVVSVIETTPVISARASGAPSLPPFHNEGELTAVRRRLREAIAESGHGARACRIDVREGSAAAAITRHARRCGARVVVIGTGAQGRIGHLVYGERALEIARTVLSPVLIVPPGATPPIERAMVAVDFSRASLRAALSAHEMLGPGGRLTLVHVKRALRVDAKSVGWWNMAFEQRTRERLEQFARVLPESPGVTVDTELLHGEPADVLTAYAHSHAMQLLACGRRDLPLLKRMFLRSVSTALIRRAQCSVLVAPER
jgi:nucleotide-binding universal stress UspA family protein